MSSIFLDSLDVDLERLQRINNTVRMIPRETLEKNNMLLRPVEAMVIAPSQEINKIAEQYAHTLPRTLRFLFRAIGAMGRDGSTLCVGRAATQDRDGPEYWRGFCADRQRGCRTGLCGPVGGHCA